MTSSRAARNRTCDGGSWASAVNRPTAGGRLRRATRSQHGAWLLARCGGVAGEAIGGWLALGRVGFDPRVEVAWNWRTVAGTGRSCARRRNEQRARALAVLCSCHVMPRRQPQAAHSGSAWSRRSYVTRRSCDAAASSPGAGSGSCSRSGSAGGSPGARARPPRRGRPR